MPTVSVVKKRNDQEGDQELISEYEIEKGAVLFDALDALGETLPHGCLAGSCGSCRIQILEGEENLSPLSAIEADTIEHIKSSYQERFGPDYTQNKTLRLSCRTKVMGPIKIIPFR